MFSKLKTTYTIIMSFLARFFSISYHFVLSQYLSFFIYITSYYALVLEGLLYLIFLKNFQRMRECRSLSCLLRISRRPSTLNLIIHLPIYHIEHLFNFCEDEMYRLFKNINSKYKLAHVLRNYQVCLLH